MNNVLNWYNTIYVFALIRSSAAHSRPQIIRPYRRVGNVFLFLCLKVHNRVTVSLHKISAAAYFDRAEIILFPARGRTYLEGVALRHIFCPSSPCPRNHGLHLTESGSGKLTKFDFLGKIDERLRKKSIECFLSFKITYGND